MKKFTVLLLLVALFATSCDSLWENVYEKPVSIRFTIPSEMLDSYAQENALRAAQGGEDNFARAGVYTGISAKVSIHDTTNDKVYSEKSLEIGDSLDDTITFDNLYIVGKTVYAQVELSQFGYETRTQRSETITVIEGYNEVALEFEDAQILSYTIRFESNGGSAIGNQIIEHNSLITSPTNPTREGYDFAGWYENSGFSGEVWDFVSDVATKNMTLYAKWTGAQYTLSFNSVGGNSIDAKDVIYGQKIGALTTPIKDGSDFTAWQIDGISINENTVWNYAENKEAVALWDVDMHTVDFESNGGSVVGQESIPYGSLMPNPGNPTREGYDFGGWFENPGLSGAAWNFASDTVAGNMTLYAKWTASTYTITYNLDGGTNFSGAPASFTVESAIINLGNPTKTGYTFEGWFDNASFSGSEIIQIVTGSTGNKTLYAKWTAETYTLTFDAAGGSGADTPRVVTYGQAIGAITEPTKTGYSLDRWEIGGVAITGGTIWNYTSDQTATAVWSVNNYTITYNLDGGTNFSGAPASFTVESATINLGNPTKTGYTFEGWFDNASFSGSEITQVVTGSTGNKTLYAKWIAKTYTLTFDAAGGSGADTPRVVTYGQAIGAITEPTRTGYTFDGWEIGGAAITGATIWNYTSNQTAVAQWIINTYTVTFNANGGSGGSSANANYNATISTPSSPSRPGYTFSGNWYTDNTYSNLWNFATDRVSKNTTLYAQWEIRTVAGTRSGNTITLVPSVSGSNIDAELDRLAPYGNRDTVTRITIEVSDGTKIVPTGSDLSYAFGSIDDGDMGLEDFTALSEIDGLENLDTSAVTDMSGMFNGCGALTTLDLSFFDTSSVTNMSSMFLSCSGLADLDLSNWDLPNLTNVSDMFGWCTSISDLNLYGWNAPNVTNVEYLFPASGITESEITITNATLSPQLQGAIQALP